MTAAGRCAAPGRDGGGCAAALSRKAAALWPGDAPREGTGPPLRRQACCASPAATALRTGPDPGDHCGPSGRKHGQAPACPALGAARPVTTGPRAPADAGERSELAFDSHKERKNYTNPLTVSVHASRGLPVGCWLGLGRCGGGGEAGEGLAAAVPGFGGQAGCGAAGVVGLAGVPGGQDALVADGEQEGEPERERGQAREPVQPRAMLLVAGSLTVEKVRSAPVRRA